MSAPNVLGCMRWQQWVVVHTTVQRRGGEAWLAWMIRSKDSLFSHCSLTTTTNTGRPSNRRASPLPPPPPFPLFACTGHSAMSSLGLCCCLPACLCSPLLCARGLLGGDGCVGCLPVSCLCENAPSSVSLPFWNFRRLSHIPSLTTPPPILPTLQLTPTTKSISSREYPCTRVSHRQ